MNLKSIFRKDSFRTTHPSFEEVPGDWYLCHPAFGAVPYEKIGFGEVKVIQAHHLEATAYGKLSDEEQDKITEKWLSDFLDWVDGQKPETIYFQGGETKAEAQLMRKCGLTNNKAQAWESEFVKVLPLLNVRNLEIVGRDFRVIAYENWDNVYINNINNLPEYFKSHL